MKTYTLDQLHKGTTCEILSFKDNETKRINKLLSYGIIPGSKIVLSKKIPTFVIKIGHTNLALSKEVARDIIVNPI
jgi:DtxR family Mn-dependent transcriptional regulator